MTIAQKLSTLVSRASYNLINGKLVESHASNAATFAVKTLAGNNPSASDPVCCLFPDASTLIITSALALTLPDQAMPGASVPTRLWFALVNDAGTPRLVMRRCQTAGIIAGFDPRGILSASSPPGSSSCTSYSNVTITDKPYRIIAFADYETALPSNSSWTTSPTRIMLVGIDTPLPGAMLQEVTGVQIGGSNTNGGTYVGTQVYKYITPSSNINAVNAHFATDFYLNLGGTTEYAYFKIYRADSVPVGQEETMYINSQTTGTFGGLYAAEVLDFPFTIAQTLYRLFFRIQVNGGVNNLQVPHAGANIVLKEIMG